MIRRLLPVLAFAAAATPLAAQTSQFGARALGNPGRAITARDAGMAGATAPLNAETSLNPATAALHGVTVAGLTLQQDMNTLQNPGGEGSLTVMRFPHLLLGGPIPNSRFGVSVSLGSYLVRDAGLVARDSITLRGQRVLAIDSLAARGSLGDIQLAVAYRFSGSASVGLGVHFLNGSDRVDYRRTFTDSTFLPAQARSETALASLGLSIGLFLPVGRKFAVAAHARADSPLQVEIAGVRVGTYALPVSLGGGFLYRPNSRFTLATSGMYRTWGRAGADLAAQGSTAGAFNTVEGALGLEYGLQRRRPWALPIRLGVRYGTLPFALTPGVQPKEFGLSLGTGTRFAAQRAGFDVAAERVVRWDNGTRRDQAFLVTATITIRP